MTKPKGKPITSLEEYLAVLEEIKAEGWHVYDGKIPCGFRPASTCPPCTSGVGAIRHQRPDGEEMCIHHAVALHRDVPATSFRFPEANEVYSITDGGGQGTKLRARILDILGFLPDGKRKPYVPQYEMRVD